LSVEEILALLAELNEANSRCDEKAEQIRALAEQYQDGKIPIPGPVWRRMIAQSQVIRHKAKAMANMVKKSKSGANLTPGEVRPLARAALQSMKLSEQLLDEAISALRKGTGSSTVKKK